MNSEKVKEIKKGLECCSTLMDNNATSEEQDNSCNECPYRLNDRCSWKLDGDALTLINELESENERLNKAINNVQKGFDNKEFISKDCKIRALKQFVEKLKEKPQNFIYDNEDYDGKLDSGILCVDLIGVIGMNGEIISLGLIDRLLKEYEK